MKMNLRAWLIWESIRFDITIDDRVVRRSRQYTYVSFMRFTCIWEFPLNFPSAELEICTNVQLDITKNVTAGQFDVFR